MPLLPIPINKGTFQNVDAFELTSPEYAADFRNFVLTDAGSNIDRPGLNQFAAVGSYPVQGLTFFSNHLVAVTSSDRKIWKIDSSGTVTDITGTALGGSARPVFADDGTYLAIAGGAAPRSWTGSGNTALLAGSPPDCKFISYLDGYWITHLIDDQEFRWAGPTESARGTWNSANFFQAEGLPDNLKAQAVLLRELYAFGAESVEIFQNFGGTSTPFQRTFFINKGIIAPYSIVEADNTLFWLDSDRRFVMMQGRTPVQVSTPFDRVIKDMTTIDDCWGVALNIGAFYLIAWTFPTEERTLVYDYKLKEWYEWDGFVDGGTDRFKMHSYTFAKAWNRHFVGDPVRGIVWELSFDNKVDGSNTLRRLRRSGQIDHGTSKRKRSNYYQLDVKRGVGTPGGTEPRLLMRVNDDGKGWKDYVSIPLGFTGERQTPIRVPGLRGIYRKRQIEFYMTDPYELSIRSLQEDVEEMES